jgi:signal transduction histidine kinase
MSVRSLVLLIPFLLTLVFGVWIVFEPRPGSVAADATRGGVRESLGLRRITTAPAQLSQNTLNKLNYLFVIVSGNKELMLYGSIALFGVLVMLLAVAGIKSGPKDRTDAVVELLKHEKEKAEHLAKLKSEFLNQVSHELRTPLAVIIGYIECITDGLYGEVETKHHEILQIVAKQSSHLKNMIDQILIYSRLEANKQPLRIEEFSVRKILDDLHDTFDFLCRQKGLKLEWELSREVDTLKTDAERFKELASNLLQNAVKYTDNGTISVKLKMLANDAVGLEVSDTGIGIAHHHLSNIFDPFMQAHKTSSENSRGGIGLGLSIVKKHVEQLKGSVTVESELGKGTTFKVVVPRAYEERRLSGQRLRTLLRLPISRKKEKAVSVGASAKEKQSDRTTINRALG